MESWLGPFSMRQNSPWSKERATTRGVHRALMRHRRYDMGATLGGWSSIPVVFFPGMAGHPCLTPSAISLSLQGEPAKD
jgi:hypothetical protein